MRSLAWLLFPGILLCAGFAAFAAEPLRVAEADWLPGVNLAGAEFTPSADDRPGGAVLGRDYIYPAPEAMDHFVDKGFRLFRVPFRAVRVVERESTGLRLGKEFDFIVDIIDRAEALGVYVVLDIHDYGRSASGGLIGRDAGATEEFAEIWRLIAERLKNQMSVMFGLMNEPHEQSAAEWLQGANAAIFAIRDTGARQIVLVPGSYWSGAWRWLVTDNAEVMLGVEDPLDNVAYEVHQYLDSDGSGRSAGVVEGAGKERLSDFTQWARKHGKRAFLGEFAWADHQAGHREAEALLSHLATNRDVWFSFAYWAAGPWWGDQMFTLEPGEDGVDRRQMQVLERYVDP